MREAFLELCEQQHAQVVAFMMRCGATLADAQDATQEAFCAAWSELTTHPERWQSVDKPGGWIRVVAIKRWRRPPGPRRRVSESPVGELPDRSNPGNEVGELTALTLTVQHVLAEIDEIARVVWAYHRDGFTNVEIAQWLDTDAQKVTDMLKKTRSVLRSALAESVEGRTA
ncbi:DNA-directed RNA polymerase specialized sigma24 family protein [Catenulispora sp. GP43]|uniref:RNA polymerase sigma factor n=1 Tax=Catenulispora sp. GP43 TaxID=3156263 RepID=UPI003513F15C